MRKETKEPRNFVAEVWLMGDSNREAQVRGGRRRARDREEMAEMGRKGAATLHRITTPEQRLEWQRKGAAIQRAKWEEYRRERDAKGLLEAVPKRKYTKRVSRGGERAVAG